MKLRNLLLIMSISLISCADKPVPPSVIYYGAYFDGLKPGFYATDLSGKALFFEGSDKAFHGAQCLKLDDFNLIQNYIESLRESK